MGVGGDVREEGADLLHEPGEADREEKRALGVGVGAGHGARHVDDDDALGGVGRERVPGLGDAAERVGDSRPELDTGVLGEAREAEVAGVDEAVGGEDEEVEDVLLDEEQDVVADEGHGVAPCVEADLGLQEGGASETGQGHFQGARSVVP